MLHKNLRLTLKFIIAGVLLFSIVGTAQAQSRIVGQTYYTAYNFKMEKGRHVTTNYWRGELIPVGSPAKLVSMGGKTLVIEVNGRSIKIVNVRKHTRKTIEEVAELLLSQSQPWVGGQFASDIKAGNLRLGMSRKEALQTRGYPPAHKTPTLETRKWVYWSSKFIQRSIAFEGGVINRGRGLY